MRNIGKRGISQSSGYGDDRIATGSGHKPKSSEIIQISASENLLTAQSYFRMRQCDGQRGAMETERRWPNIGRMGATSAR